MGSVAATPKRRRGGRRIVVALVILVLIVVGSVVWLNVAAQAQVSASGTLTVYQPAASVSHNGPDFASALTGSVVQPGDSVKTDTKGRAAITLPDGTIPRLASDTTIKVDAAHLTKSGNLHDVTLTQQIGRTFTNVQHLGTGGTFNVKGKSATASVRGTKFEVYIKTDGTMIIKLFEGHMVVTSGNQVVAMSAPSQVTVDPSGHIGDPGPIVPDPNDPFGPALDAQNAVAVGTTPGTEQDFVGASLHNGEQQTYSYSYAGGSAVKASLGYPGSAMKLTVKAPDGQSYVATGKLPTVTVKNGPAGIYTIIVDGGSGLGTRGEEPFVAVASAESCVSADMSPNHAVHRGYTAHDLILALNQSGGVPGLSNLTLTISENSVAGAIITGKGTYNGFGWSGSVVLVAHNGVFGIMPTSGTGFGQNFPGAQGGHRTPGPSGPGPPDREPRVRRHPAFYCQSVLEG